MTGDMVRSRCECSTAPHRKIQAEFFNYKEAKGIKTELDSLPKVLAFECLLKRISSSHHQRDYLDNQLHRVSAGIRGEDRMVVKFKEFTMKEEHVPMWDLKMELAGWAVQIDGLLLTERCAIVMDSKNVSGEIHYNEATEEYYKKAI